MSSQVRLEEGVALLARHGVEGRLVDGRHALDLALEIEPVPVALVVHAVRGRILATFGEQAKGLQNDGINIAAARGTPIKAAENGVVAYAGNELRGFGNLLLVRHADGLMTAYAHADQLLVQRGDVVRRGQTIAKVGSTGAVTEPQIHFEVRKAGTPVDPEKYLGNPGDARLITPDDRILRPDLG